MILIKLIKATGIYVTKSIISRRRKKEETFFVKIMCEKNGKTCEKYKDCLRASGPFKRRMLFHTCKYCIYSPKSLLRGT